jgi:hypothetical protein
MVCTTLKLTAWKERHFLKFIEETLYEWMGGMSAEAKAPPILKK